MTEENRLKAIARISQRVYENYFGLPYSEIRNALETINILATRSESFINANPQNLEDVKDLLD